MQDSQGGYGIVLSGFPGSRNGFYTMGLNIPLLANRSIYHRHTDYSSWFSIEMVYYCAKHETWVVDQSAESGTVANVDAATDAEAPANADVADLLVH